MKGCSPFSLRSVNEMSKKFRVFVNDIEQNTIFDSDTIGQKLPLMLEMMGGCVVRFEEFKNVEPSNEFKVDGVYYCRSVGDHNCIFRAKITKRSDKSVWIESDLWKKRCAVKKDENGVEYFSPEHYSFAPIFRANKVADGVHDLPDWAMC